MKLRISACLLTVLLFAPFSVFAAATIRTTAGNITVTNNTNSSTASVSVPTGIAANDLITIIIIGNNHTDTWTPPSGFSEVGTVASVGIYGGLWVYQKVATGSESGSFSFTASGTAHWFLTCFTVTGVSTTLAANSENGVQSSYTASLSFAGASVATGAAGNYVVFVAASIAGSGSSETVTSYTPATSFTNRYSNYNAAYASYSLKIDDWTDPTSHTTTYTSSSAMSASDNYGELAATLVFTPSGGAPAATGNMFFTVP
jgi:hypothetical protein